MKKKTSSRGRNRGSGKRGAKQRVLSRLSPDESAEVLRMILAAHPELAKEAEALAESLLKGASVESIADEVVYEIRALDVEDVLKGSGRHSWGYVDPGEAASNNLLEVIRPYIDNITRCMELGIEDEALEICKGVVLGLYRLEHGEKLETLDWAGDFPSLGAGETIRAWEGKDMCGKKTKAKGALKDNREFPRDFVQTFLPDWSKWILS